eukprot:3274784-Rhodomonas_salina.2
MVSERSRKAFAQPPKQSFCCAAGGSGVHQRAVAHAESELVSAELKPFGNRGSTIRRHSGNFSWAPLSYPGLSWRIVLQPNEPSND